MVRRTRMELAPLQLIPILNLTWGGIKISIPSTTTDGYNNWRRKAEAFAEAKLRYPDISYKKGKGKTSTINKNGHCRCLAYSCSNRLLLNASEQSEYDKAIRYPNR